MPSHQDPVIVSTIEKSQEILNKMNSLQIDLEKHLKEEWKEILGIDFPSVATAKLFKLDVAMLFAHDVSIDEFLSGASTLTNTIFGRNLPDVALAATDIVKVAITNIIGHGGAVQLGFHGNAGHIEHNDLDYLAACYSSTQCASAHDWGTSTDFFVAKYAYVVMLLSSSHLATLKLKNKLVVR